MTNFAFPPNWEKVELSDIAIFQNGYAFKSSTYSDAGDFVIRIGNVQDTGINLNNPAYVNATKLNAEKFRLSKDDILMSLTGNVGRTAIIKEEHLPAVLNQRVARVIFSSLMEGKFNFYLLRSSIVQSDLLKCAKGAAQLNISTKDIDKIIVGIPSIKEQKIIAEKLDTLLTQVDSTKARLEQIPQILKRFRQAVLAAAVSGKLITESDNQKKITIGSLCFTSFDGPFGSKLKTSDYSDSGIRVVRLENIGHLEFKSEKETFISYKKYEGLSSNTLQENDLLFSSFVDEDVRVCLVPKSNDTFINKADCFCLRINPSLASPQYVSLVLASKTSYEQIKERVQGITRPRINLRTLRSLTFDIPPLPEQHEIVRRVEQLFAYADTIEKQVNNALTRVNNLTQSILAKTFRGELTAQWRAENPELISGENSATALLEKIKAERAASGSKKVSRKKK
ncbi:restriction endonuclease subunit S [Providencia rettgeri]|nr:restriction endonuclease subunit S [Providencia rettgeri]EJD6662384.1 restriction endonuclease subunit S [Providencia rettgeri]ELR5077731.1 restriction endonuclease subunit S [Providencia rettgeri]ELR5172399.1 restriction endonuclease subunit S [Providencia rettgeri]ELR5194735.1 restriction endonuclease subunit S [Providencia rettgeri]EMB8478057.1 restriction endonuclease subunit S [Providencia rettgeri]